MSFPALYRVNTFLLLTALKHSVGVSCFEYSLIATFLHLLCYIKTQPFNELLALMW